MSEAKASKPYKLSTYGEDREWSTPMAYLVFALTYVLFLGASLLPAILLLSGILYVVGWISTPVLATVVSIALLDFVIPLPDPLRPNQAFCRSLVRAFAQAGADYFPARSIFLPEALDPQKAYILAAWPHSLVGGGCHFGFSDFHERGIFPIYSAASITKYVPLARRFLATNGTCDVSKKSLSKILDVKANGPSYPHNVVHLVVGGILEMFCTPGDAPYEQIVLSKRKGFIKLALETGAGILPYYSFGANQTYYRLFGPRHVFATLSSKLQLSILVWFGRWWIPMGIFPFRVPILSVTGPVFVVPKVKKEDITDDLVQRVHQDFCKAFRAMFDEYKVVYVREMGAPEEWLTRELKFEDEA